MPAFLAPAVGAAAGGGAGAAAAGTAAAGTAAGAAGAAAGTAAAPAAFSFLQPWMLNLLPSAARGIHSLIAPDRQTQIFTDVLAAQTEFRNMLARRAIGRFTPAEAQEIEAGGEKQVNAVAGNVASRGLGSSPAGAAVIADAQGQVYSQARREAMSALPAYDNLIAQQARTLMASDNSFNEDLSAIVRLLQQEFDEDPKARTDTDFISVVETIWKSLGSPMPQTAQ